MKILVFMSDNRDCDGAQASFLPLSISINKTYCEMNGYDFIYYQPYLDKPNPRDPMNCIHFKTSSLRYAAWSKLISTMNALHTTDYDYVVYIDSDCIFKDHSQRIETFISQTEKDILFFQNTPWGDDLPCSGFFIMKVCNETRNFVKDWFNFDIPSKNEKHAWEQDALWSMDCSSKYHIINIPQFLEKEHQFIRHICNWLNNDREPYFRKFIRDNLISTNISEIRIVKFDTRLCESLF